MRVLHLGVGVRGFVQAAGRLLKVDDTHLDLEVTAIQQIDFAARQEGYCAQDPALAVDLLAPIIPQTGGGDPLDQNTTTVRLEGLGLLEVPITYGYARNDHISSGANLKVMVGRVCGTEVVVFNNDSGDGVSDATDGYEESVSFGLDLAAMARYDHFQAGLVVRNLNAPKCDGPTVVNPATSQPTTFHDVTVDPQATLGVASFPIATVTIEADVDLLSNQTAFRGDDTQDVSLGLE